MHRLVLQLVAKEYLVESESLSVCLGEQADNFCMSNVVFSFSVPVKIEEQKLLVLKRKLEDQNTLIEQLKKSLVEKDVIIAKKDALLAMSTKENKTIYLQSASTITNIEKTLHLQEKTSTEMKSKRLSYRKSTPFSCGNCHKEFYFYLAALDHLKNTRCRKSGSSITIDYAMLQKETISLGVTEWKGLESETAASPLNEPPEPSIPEFNTIEKKGDLFLCPFASCSYTHGQKSFLQRHYFIHATNPDGTVAPTFACRFTEKCFKKFNRMDSGIFHIKTQHLDSSLIPNAELTHFLQQFKWYDTIVQMFARTSTNSSIAANQSEIAPHQCEHCPMRFHFPSGLKYHVAIHTADK